MTTADAFLADIIAHPGDDAPRLIFADWLDDHGDPERGEFIRVQCELAGLKEPGIKTPANILGLSDEEYSWVNCTGGCDWYPTRHKAGTLCRWHALRRRERELLRGPRPEIYENEVVWFNEGDGTETWRILFRPGWRRGFVWRVRCLTEHWLRHGPALVRAAPLERVELSDRGPAVFYDSDGRPPLYFVDDGGPRWAAKVGHYLPPPLFAALGRVRSVGNSREYESKAAALDALPAAYLAWARAATEPSPAAPAAVD